MKTILALDVDGPLNATRAGWGRARTRRYVTDPDGFQWAICYELELINALRTMHLNGIVEIVWCTTWCHHAHVLEELWGLPPLRRAWTGEKRGEDARVAKLAYAREVLSHGGKLIWADDTETPTSEIFPDTYEEMTSTGRALLIRPKSNRGLRPADLDSMLSFAGEDL